MICLLIKFLFIKNIIIYFRILLFWPRYLDILFRTPYNIFCFLWFINLLIIIRNVFIKLITMILIRILRLYTWILRFFTFGQLKKIFVLFNLLTWFIFLTHLFNDIKFFIWPMIIKKTLILRNLEFILTRWIRTNIYSPILSLLFFFTLIIIF